MRRATCHRCGGQAYLAAWVGIRRIADGESAELRICQPCANKLAAWITRRAA